MVEVKFLTEEAPDLLSLLMVEDEDDLGLLLLFWCLAKTKKATVPPEIARLN